MRKCLALCLCALALLGALGGCAALDEASPYREGDFDTSGAVSLRLPQEACSEDAKSIPYYIENHSGEELAFGLEYSLEAYRHNRWVQLPFRKGAAFAEIGVRLQSGESYRGEADLDMLAQKPAAGVYRLVKAVGEKLYAALFRIERPAAGEESYTPLERLPREYSLDMAVKNGDVVFAPEGQHNTGRILNFLEAVSLGEEAALRLVRFTAEGDPIIYDIGYTPMGAGGCFLYRTDTSRDAFGGADTGISSCCRSYLISDGTGVYLSNCGDYEAVERYGAASNLWLFDGYVEPVLGMMEQRGQGESAPYRVYNREGENSVRLFENALDFGYGPAGEECLGSLRDPEGIALRIKDAVWVDTERFVLVCETGGLLRYFAAVSAPTGEVESIGYGSGFDASGQDILCLA